MSFGKRDPWTLRRYLVIGAASFVAAIGAGAAGCGGNGSTATGGGGPGGAGGASSSAQSTTHSSTHSSSHSSGATGGGGAGGTGNGGAGGAGGGTGGAGGGGGPPVLCPTVSTIPGRGSAIATTPDDKRLVTVNRDVGTVTVMTIDYTDGQPAMTQLGQELAVGNEPWSVVIDACGTRAYVVARQAQQLTEIVNLDGTPAIGRTVGTGSEPTAVALSPDNTKIYVANWVDGTVGVYDASSMTLSSTVDLNPVLVGTGLLGPSATPRPALAHPRALAVDVNGDVYATEWAAQRTAPEAAGGTNSDVNWKGLLYRIPVGGGAVTTLDLPPVLDAGAALHDHKDQVTGCFPNQVASVTIQGTHAYVTSTCASPRGPIGVFVKGTCATDAQCVGGALGSCVGPDSNGGVGSCKGSCTVNADCGANGGVCDVANGGACKPNAANVKTTTHPAVSVVDLANGTGTTTNIDALYNALSNGFPRRMPLLPTDLAFFSGTFGYLASEGADALFKFTVDGTGAISTVGSSTNNFIDMRRIGQTPPDTTIRLPIGVAMSHTANAFAFVANDGSRDVNAIALQQQAIAGNQTTDFRITQSSALPTQASDISILNGKRFFNTGLGRWSLAGEAWGSCAACHIDGLSDNVTWYFARGPRQTVSLDGSFAKGGAMVDQRIFNWTAIFDEVADFEGNTRGISGGVGALVSAVSTPPAVGDRINTGKEAPPQQALQGSSFTIAQPCAAPCADGHVHSVKQDWIDITNWVMTVRSPRKPTNLDPNDVMNGRTIFEAVGQGNCIGCHSGPKWTISTRFWTPGDTTNAATGSASPPAPATSLGVVQWTAANLNGFPGVLQPVTAAVFAANGNRMRVGSPAGATALEQMLCIVRPVGTFGVSDQTAGTGINVLELRQDMTTVGQGNEDTGRGFNPPALVGMQVGAPFFHAGNARTLEELFDVRFAGHHSSAVTQVFSPNSGQIKQLVAFILAIDAGEATVPIPAVGTAGGDFCHP